MFIGYVNKNGLEIIILFKSTISMFTHYKMKIHYNEKYSKMVKSNLRAVGRW